MGVDPIPIASGRRKNQFVMAARGSGSATAAARKPLQPEHDELAQLLDELEVPQSGSTFVDSFEAVCRASKDLALSYERFLRSCKLAYNRYFDGRKLVTSRAIFCAYDMAMAATSLTEKQRHNLGMMLMEELSALEKPPPIAPPPPPPVKA